MQTVEVKQMLILVLLLPSFPNNEQQMYGCGNQNVLIFGVIQTKIKSKPFTIII
jgi:hypothetical protein